MKILSSSLTLLAISLTVTAQDPQRSPQSQVPVPQQLRIRSQPDAPLRIESANVSWATPSDRAAVQVYIVVENVGSKSVRMYETRRDVNSTTGPKSCLGPPVIPGRLLRPGQKAGTSTWQGVFNTDPAPEVWIDFVEFADGTVWGTDECHVAEWLDGSRTGIRMQREQLLAILHEKGAEALMAFIKANFKKEIDLEAYEKGERPLLPIAPPPGHPRSWESAFSSGAERTVNQVIEAYWAWGAEEIEHVLTRPIVPTESRSH